MNGISARHSILLLELHFVCIFLVIVFFTFNEWCVTYIE